VLTAVVTQSGAVASVHSVQTAPPNSTEDTVPVASIAEPAAETETTVEVKEGPSPIAPEPKEVLWGAGAFLVFLVAMRLWLFPKLKKGMDARYGMIREQHETADTVRARAQAEVAEYQAQLATVKAEAAAIIDEAREQLETQRSARLAEVNAEIAAKRLEANAEMEAARAAVQDQVASAVSDVTSRAIEIVTGKPADAAMVDRVVGEVVGAGVAR
jgi:F-type H+-transporting ATPase subunit b